MKKSVLIITGFGAAPGGANFGSALQSYALMSALAALDCDAYLVRYTFGRKRSFWKNLLICIGLLGLVRWVKTCAKTHKLFLSNTERRLLSWNKAHYKMVNVRTKWGLRHMAEQAYCIMSGSDQIWNTYHDFNPFYFLSFAKGLYCVSYASSIGTDSVAEPYREPVRELLANFNRISVREAAGVAALKELTQRSDIVRMPDPTFLITPVDWKLFAADTSLHQDICTPYLLCYFIADNHEYHKNLKDVIDKVGISNVVMIPSAEHCNAIYEGTIQYRYASPSEFVALLNGASFVCTDSFHATAFCLNLGKNFVEFIRFKDGDKDSQNSRIYEMLNRFELGWKIYCDNNNSWLHDVDWTKVQGLIKSEREIGFAYLKDVLEKK